MIHRNTTQIDEATEEFLGASAGLWEILESVLNSFSFSFGNTPHRLYGEQPEGDSANNGEAQPALEANKQWDGGEQSPPPHADSLQLDWYGTVPQAISEALNLTFLPKMDELIRQSTECCATIGDAIGEVTTAVREIESCCKPTAEAPTQDISERMGEIEREIRRATKPAPIEEVLGWEEVIAGLVGEFGAHALKLGTIPSNLLAVWFFLQAAHMDELFRRLIADPSDLRNWSAERVEGLEELDRRYPKSRGNHGDDQDNSVLDAFFRQAWLEWQRAVRKLIENIESPDSSQHLREESSRVLPDVVDDIERALELYRNRHGGREAPFDPELLDRAKELLQRTPPIGPEPQPGSDLLSRNSNGARGRASEYDVDPLTLASYSPDAGRGRSAPDRAQEQFERVLDLLDSLTARLREPVRLEVRLLDDRVIARRLDGNRSVDVDLSRGYRMVGYISV